MTDLVSGGAEAYEWIQLLAVSGLAGALGQGARVIVGLKKVNDAASDTGVSTASMIEPSRLFVSLLVGFIAGALAGIAILKPAVKISVDQILGMAAAGYAGADFIEGFVRKIGGSSSSGDSSGGKAPPVTPDGAVG